MPLDVDQVALGILEELDGDRCAVPHVALAKRLNRTRKTIASRCAHLRRLGLTTRGQFGEVATARGIAWIRHRDEDDSQMTHRLPGQKAIGAD